MYWYVATYVSPRCRINLPSQRKQPRVKHHTAFAVQIANHHKKSHYLEDLKKYSRSRYIEAREEKHYILQ